VLWPVAAAVCSYAILLWPTLFEGKVLAPTDLLLSSSVIGSITDGAFTEASNELLFDPVYVFLPWLDFAARQLREGEFPLWNPYSFCGVPFLANNQSGLLSLWNWIFFAFPSPRVLGWIQLLKAAVAALGAALALRTLGVRSTGGLLLAALYPLSGFMIVWMQYPLSGTAVWLPWVVWATLSAVRQPGPKSIFALGLSVALLCLAGHLETAAQVLVGLGLFLLLALPNLARVDGAPHVARGLAFATLAGMCGLGLAAPQILPTLDYVRHCRRVQLREQGKIESVLKEPNQWAEVFRVVQPYAFGSRQKGSKELRTVCINEGGANGYAGALTLALALTGLLWGGPFRIPLLLTALLCAAPALRIPLLSSIEHMPPLNVMNNARLLLVTGWCTLCLAALTVDDLARGVRKNAVLVVVGGLTLGLGILGSLVLVSPPVRVLHFYTTEHWPWFRAHFAPTVLSLVAGGAMMIAIALVHARPLPAFLVAVMLVEGIGCALGYNPVVDPDSYFPETDLIGALKERVTDEYRVLGLGGALAPNVPMMYGLRDIRGYDGADPLPYVDILLEANPAVRPRPYAALARYWLGPGPLANMLSVRWIVTDQRLLVPDWYRVGRFSGLYLYENLRAVPRCFVPKAARQRPANARAIDLIRDPSYDPRDFVWVDGRTPLPPGPYRATARLIHDSANTVELCVRAETEALVVLTDRWAAGWRVSVDGQPQRALMVNGILRGAIVPKGHHHVRWRYIPSSFFFGTLVALVSAILLGIEVGVSYFWLRHHPPDNPVGERGRNVNGQLGLPLHAKAADEHRTRKGETKRAVDPGLSRPAA